MKRNELLAKSLTLGLAVATAATSMSVPGGLLAPQTAYAADAEAGESTVTPSENEGDNESTEATESLTKDNVKKYFRLMSKYIAVPESGNAKVIWGYALDYATDNAGETAVGTPTFTLKAASAENNTELSNLKADTEYTVYVTVTGGKEIAKTDTPIELGTVTALTELPDSVVTLTFKSGDTEGSDKYFTKDVTVSAGEGITLGSDENKLADTYIERYPEDTLAQADKDVVSGVTLLIKKGEKIYIKEIKIQFTKAPEISAFSADESSIKADSATVSVTFNKAGKVYYVIKEEETQNISAETIKGDSNVKTMDDLTAGAAAELSLNSLDANTSYYVYAVAEDTHENLSKVKSVFFTTLEAQKEEITGTISITDDKDADISKLAVGDTIKAKYESGNATNAKYQWYRVPAEGEAEAIEGATEETYTVTTDDLGYTLKVVVSDADLSGTQNATTSVAVAKKDYDGEAPKFGESCFDEEDRTLTATVAENTTVEQLEYSLDGGTTWTKGNADDTILTVDGTSAKLTLDAKAYEANKIQIRVAATDDTEASDAATYTTAIPRKGVDLSKATVKINNAEETSFTYTGKNVITSVDVSVGENALDKSKYQVYYTDSNATEAGTDTAAPTAVGEYKLWIVPADGADEDCYGSKIVEFSIKAVEVTSTEDLKKYVDYEDIATGTLTYNGADQSDVVVDAVNVKKDYDDESIIENVNVTFKKQGENSDTEFVNAGTYDVYVELTGNIATKAPVKIGTAVIDKYQPKDEDVTISDKTITYNGAKAAVEISKCNTLLDEKQIKITYKQGETEVTEPINAGKYEVYVSYEGDDNCEALTGTEKKAELIIDKATDNTSFDALVVKTAEDTSEQEYDLSKAVTKWALAEKDTNVAATVKVDEAYAGYITDLKYDAGSKKITFSLSDEGKALKEQKEFAIHVDFGESFTNYNVAFDIPVIITDKSLVSIEVNEKDALTYDGKEKSLTYKISGDGFTEISSATNDTENFTVTITKDGEEVSEIKDAGTYVVTAEYASETNYGKLVQEVTVTPKMVTEVEDLFTLGSLDLKYDMKTNFFDKIIAAVEAKADAGITDDDYTIWVDQTVDTADGYSLAGDATVSIEITGGNYRTNGKVQLGTVTIAKGTIALTVTATNKGEVTVKVGDKVIPNDDVTIEYYKGDAKLDAKPTEPGDYKVKVIYTDDANLIAPATGEAAFTIPTSGGNTSGGSTSGGSSSSGGGSATTPSKDDTKKDDNSKTETKPDGTKVTTTETKAEDGSVQTKIELKNDTTGVDATVNVAKDAQGKVTGATADVIQKSSDNKTAISAATVAQITEAAGTKDVEITTKTVDAQGQTVREVTVNASDLTAGKKLKVVMVDPKTGEKTLVNKTTYKVAADGSLALNNLGDGSYEVVTTAELNALTKEILKTVKPDKTKKNVTVGKKTKFTLNDELNMDNVAKITYKTGKKSVATVNANGTITAKKAGKVTIKAVVTLNNGKKKTIKMTITVKKKK